MATKPFDDKQTVIKRTPHSALTVRIQPSPTAGLRNPEVVLEFANDRNFITVLTRTEAKALRDWLSTKYLKR